MHAEFVCDKVGTPCLMGVDPLSATEDGIIEARVSHRKSSQQHTQAGPKKYTKIANELKNNTTGGGAKRRPLWGAAEGGALLFFNSFAIFVCFLGPACVCR